MENLRADTSEPISSRRVAIGPIVFSAFASLVITLGVVNSCIFERNYRAAVGRQLEAIAALKVAELCHWRDERLEDGRAFKDNDYFEDMLSTVFRTPGRTVAQGRLLSWMKRTWAGGMYDRFFLFDERGDILVAYPSIGVDDPTLAQASVGMDSGESPHFFDLYRNAIDSRIYLSIMIPLGDEVDHGVLALRIDPERYLFPYLMQWPTDSRTAETLIVRREGTDVVFLNRLRFNDTAALNLRFDIESSPVLPAANAARGERRVVAGRDYRGISVVAAVRPVDNSPWFLVARMDESEVDAISMDRRFMMASLAAALIAAGAIGTLAANVRWRLTLARREADALATVRASEERLRLALVAANQGFYDLDVRTGEAVVNDEYARMLGYDPATFKETNAAWADRLHPDDRENVYSTYRDYIAGRIPDYRIEFRQRTSDGSWKWVLSLGKIIERDPIGEPIRMLGTHTDITARKYVEEALRASELRFRKTLDDMLEGCQIISFDWRYLYLNEAAMRYWKVACDDLVGHTIFECFPGIENSDFYSALLFCMEHRSAKIEEFEFRYPDGVLGWFQMSIQPSPEGLFVLTLDVSERKRQERQLIESKAELERRVAERTAQLEASNDELRSFAYSIAHDLRAPLRSIDGFARILGEEYSSALDEEGHRLLGIVRSSAWKLDALIRDLLEVAKIGNMELTMKKIDMGSIVASAFRSCADPAALADFELVVGELPTVMADAQMIERVWVNLLSNAVKYSLPCPVHRIEVTATMSSDSIVAFSVRDYGVGFDPRYSEKLFGLFQRLHGASEFQGSGVGLAVVRRIIARHGGRVWAESREGSGAIFHFSLPTCVAQSGA